MTEGEREPRDADPRATAGAPVARSMEPRGESVGAAQGEEPRPTGRPGATRPSAPLYRGGPLDAERGPGLGCFWAQIAVLAVLVVLTPVGVGAGWPIWLTGGMLVATIVLLLFAGQTVVFLLRLVAADRRTRRRPLRGTTPTVGDLEEPAAPGPLDPPDPPGRGSSGVRQ